MVDYRKDKPYEMRDEKIVKLWVGEKKCFLVLLNWIRARQS